jgi:hypothetical protein
MTQDMKTFLKKDGSSVDFSPGRFATTNLASQKRLPLKVYVEYHSCEDRVNAAIETTKGRKRFVLSIRSQFKGSTFKNSRGWIASGIRRRVISFLVRVTPAADH